MTKVTVFGEQESKADKKPIEFVWWIDLNNGRQNPNNYPSEYCNLCLLGRDPTGTFDLIMAYDDGEKTRDIYLGHWNDGVV